MVNKRGWLRIVEAFVAVLIVFGSVMTISMTNKNKNDGTLCSTLTPLLEEIAGNEQYRVAILAGRSEEITKYLQERIKNPSVESEVKICKACIEGVACTPEENICTHSQSGIDYDEICAGERVISDSTIKANTGQAFEPK
jgi:hypothetical protein